MDVKLTGCLRPVQAVFQKGRGGPDQLFLQSVPGKNRRQLFQKLPAKFRRQLDDKSGQFQFRIW